MSSKTKFCAAEMDLSSSNSASVKSAIERTLRDEAVEAEWVVSRSVKSIARRSLSMTGSEVGIAFGAGIMLLRGGMDGSSVISSPNSR